MQRQILIMMLATLTSLTQIGRTQSAPNYEALARMPVKEITVFKDGHAYIIHEGNMPVNSAGNVELDYLPNPLLGTFWPYSNSTGAKLATVTASGRKLSVPRTALTLKELLEANVGATIIYTDVEGKHETATILGFPSRSGAEQEASLPPDMGERLPIKGELVLLKQGDKGTFALPVTRIRSFKFLGEFKKETSDEEFRNLMTMHLDWHGKSPSKSTPVGLMYVQKGIRWIPNYKIVIDGKGNAKIKLSATVINDLLDFKDVTANFVVGVPNFAFKDTLDPIGLQQTMAQLSPYFQADSRSQNALSNSIMGQGGFSQGGGATFPSQQGQGRGNNGIGDSAIDTVPQFDSGTKNEDMFVYSVKHLTMKKFERLNMPIGEYDVKYKDIYTLDIPFAPPATIRANVYNEQLNELNRVMSQSNVVHKLRLVNSSKAPITTAPALLMSSESGTEKVISQTTTNYAAIGSQMDITLAIAGDIQVHRNETEKDRVPTVVEAQRRNVSRINMSGVLSLINYKDQTVEVEVARGVIGHVVKADNNGIAIMNDIFDYSMPGLANLSNWYQSYAWPEYWKYVNGIGKFKWTISLKPGKSIDLHYDWYYISE